MSEVRKSVLISQARIARRVRELANAISRDYEGKDLVVIGILKGAFIFMADLIRHLHIPCTLDFVRLESYGTGTASSGMIELTKDIETEIEGRNVLIVEDILDTGLTLSFLVEKLKKKGPESLKVCVFLDKRERRKVPIEGDYVGFEIPDQFVVGYGLDFGEMYRFLPDICVVEEN